MERFLILAAFVVGLAMPASAQDLVAGIDVYERSDYSRAD